MRSADFGSIIDVVADYITPTSVKAAQAAETALAQQQASTQKIYAGVAVGALVIAGIYFLRKRK